MKLRTSMLGAMSVLVAAIVAATVVVVILVIGRAERDDLASNLARSRRVFDEYLSYRQTMLKSDCHVVANEPMLRATVGTPDVTRETILGVIGDLRQSLGSDMFLLTDDSGQLLADALNPNAEGFDMTETAVVKDALRKRDASAIWIAGDRPHQVHACRIDFGDRVAGIVVVGDLLDDAVAAALERQTGTRLAIALDGKRVADSQPKKPATVAAVTAKVGEAETEVTVDGADFAAVGGRLPGYTGSRSLTFAMLRSLDEALAPGRQLARSLFVIAAIALLAAIVLAGLIARRLSRPVDELVQVTRRIAAGKLDARAQPRGPTEIRELAKAMNEMIEELAKSRSQMSAKERLEREMEIAARIQTSILPRSYEVPGLEIAARMIPASEVGGDYYDIVPVEKGCWIGIGDVAGHGLTAGLEMLMVQSVISALVREKPNAMPSQLLSVLNAVIFENVRNRLRQDEHVTLTLLRHQDGTLTFAGAHEEIVVLRKGARTCERLQTPGTWIGGMREISAVTKNTRVELETGDIVVLYSDGITEAMNADRQMFGMDRLCEIVETNRDKSVDVIRDAIVDAVTVWQNMQDDDLTVVVLRRNPDVIARAA